MRPTITKIKLFSVVALLLLPLAGQVHAKDKLTLLKLVQAERFQEAYQLAELLFDDFAGEPEFDFLYGLAARNSGNHQSAIFAFERVILNRPTELRARVALAVAYYELNNFKAAQTEFSKALALKPNQSVIKRINQYIELMDNKIMRSREHFYGSLTAGIGHDSNVNSGLGDDSKLVPILGTPLEATFAVASDSQAQIKANLSYDHPMTKTDTAFASVGASKTTYQEQKDFVKRTLDVSAGYRGAVELFSYQVVAYAQPFWLATDKYQDSYGMSANALFAVGESDSIVLGTNLARIDNVNDDSLDLNQAGVNVSYKIRSGYSQHQFKVGVAAERVKTFDEISKRNERNVYSLGYNYITFLGTSLQLYGGVDVRISQHQHEDLKFFVLNEDGSSSAFYPQREDESFNYSLGLDWYFASDWVWQNSVRYSDKQSNVEIYDYDRELYTSSVQYRF